MAYQSPPEVTPVHDRPVSQPVEEPSWLKSIREGISTFRYDSDVQSNQAGHLIGGYHNRHERIRPRAPIHRGCTSPSSSTNPPSITQTDDMNDLFVITGDDTEKKDLNDHEYDGADDDNDDRRAHSSDYHWGAIEESQGESLSESWKLLQYFSRTNFGRHLDQFEAVTSVAQSPSDNCHFVNISDNWNRERQGSTADVERKCDDCGIDGELKLRAENDGPHQTACLNHESTFSIPELPIGSHLQINILSTWGDPYYVGLMGLEIYDASGHRVTISNVKKQVTASPSDINVLPNHRRDPRTIDKLFDNVYLTCDDMHAWLAPFTNGSNHLIDIHLDEMERLSMLRFWNYNKSRIHSYRGARYVEITLDGSFIFRGEIKRAPGAVVDVSSCSECVLFTTNETTLQMIAKYDEYVHCTMEELRKDDGDNMSDGLQHKDVVMHSWITGMLEERPKTAQRRTIIKPSENHIPETTTEHYHRPLTAPIRSKSCTCRVLRLDIMKTWGDYRGVGFAGLTMYAPTLEEIALTADMISVESSFARPDEGTPETRNIMMHDRTALLTDSDMWFLPLVSEKYLHSMTPGVLVSIQVDFRQERELAGMKIWNYNPDLERSFCGIRQLHVYADNTRLSPVDGFIVRKAPGNSLFDYGQYIPFDAHTDHICEENTFMDHSYNDDLEKQVLSVNPDEAVEDETNTSSEALFIENSLTCSVPQQYETPLHPSGYIIKFMLLSTYGDSYYIGLNGLEIYDVENQLIRIEDCNAHAFPRDINDLPDGTGDDVRTLDKLFDRVNETDDPTHMWLAPFQAAEGNVIFAIYESPVAISRITFWNYSKTVTRGVKEMEVYIDDVLVWHGYLRRASTDGIETGQSLLFTNNARIIEQEKDRIYNPDESDEETSVVFIDEGIPMNKSSMASSKRPHTAVVRNRS